MSLSWLQIIASLIKRNCLFAGGNDATMVIISLKKQLLVFKKIIIIMYPLLSSEDVSKPHVEFR